MYIVWMLIVGLIVGLIAKLLMPGRVGGGIVTTLLLGVTGSLVAGLIWHAFGWSDGAWNSVGTLASIGGAMLLLLAYQLINGARTSSAQQR